MEDSLSYFLIILFYFIFCEWSVWITASIVILIQLPTCSFTVHEFRLSNQSLEITCLNFIWKYEMENIMKIKNGYSYLPVNIDMHEWVNCFSCVRLFATLWTVAHQALLFMGLSRQEYCLETEPTSLLPEMAGEFFTTSTTWEAL